MTKEEWEESEEIYFRKIDQMGLINVTKKNKRSLCGAG